MPSRFLSPFFPNLAVRDRQPEVMDQPGLAAAAHWQALAGLARLNRVSLASRPIWKRIAPVMKREPNRTWRLLDIACGGGDVAIDLAKLSRTAGLKLTLTGCDISETALEAARSNAAAAKVEAKFHLRNVLAEGLPGGFDFMTCTLFLHHLEETEAAQLLRDLHRAAGTLAIVSDLRRSRRSYALAMAACWGLSRSEVVRVDGPLSVRAAFTLDEVRHLAEQAGVSESLQVRRVWPMRFLLALTPPAEERP